MDCASALALPVPPSARASQGQTLPLIGARRSRACTSRLPIVSGHRSTDDMTFTCCADAGIRLGRVDSKRQALPRRRGGCDGCTSTLERRRVCCHAEAALGRLG